MNDDFDKYLIIFFGALIFSVFLAIASIGYNIYQHEKIRDQAVALEIWKNCPMPPAGFWLIVESDWLGKQANEQFRCSFARQLATAPLRSPRAY